MTESKHGRQELAKMVRLDNDVHDRITRIGRMNESYNDVIRRLLDFYEKAHKQ